MSHGLTVLRCLQANRKGRHGAEAAGGQIAEAARTVDQLAAAVEIEVDRALHSKLEELGHQLAATR